MGEHVAVFTKVLEAAAAIAVVFLTAWLLVKAVYKTGRWLVEYGAPP